MNLLDVHRVRLKVTGVISGLNSSIDINRKLTPATIWMWSKMERISTSISPRKRDKIKQKKKQDNINAMSNVQILGVTNIILVTFVTYLALLLPKLKATLLDVTSVLLNAYSA